MKVLLLGAGGFIGSAVLERLLAAGHEVVACTRDRANLPVHHRVTFKSVDLGRMLEPVDWGPLLKDVHAVVNCAGILRERRAGDFERVHCQAPLALARACMDTGVRPFVQISALGHPADGEFVASKHRFDDALLAMKLPAWILRPSVVLSLRGSYGGTSSLRAAAALPGMLLLPGDGRQRLQPMLLEDLAEVTVRAVAVGDGYGQPLELGGPEVLTIRETLKALRAWLKLPPPRWELQVPEFMVNTLASLGDGLRVHPLGRATWRMLQRGNTTGKAAPDRLYDTLGVRLQSVTETLACSASFVQDRWHALLSLLAPLAWLALVIIWLVSAVAGLTASPEQYGRLLSEMGIPTTFHAGLTLASSVLNLILGLLLLVRWRMRPVLWAMLISVGAYTLGLSIASLSPWLEPLGGLVKNLAVAALAAFCLITQRAR